MSHPDPLHDHDNSYEDDNWWTERLEDDEVEANAIDPNYDDHDDFYSDSMDGDHDSAMTSAGFGTNEDYGDYGNDNDDYYGEDF